jgi:hypothetical protein
MSEFLLQLRWTGRFGNRLLQYAYGATYARRPGLDYWLPSEWEGTRLFKRQMHPVVANEEIRFALARPGEGPASNQAHMEVVNRHFPDAELVDTEILPDPYATRGHAGCHANGCAFNAAIFAGMSRAPAYDRPNGCPRPSRGGPHTLSVIGRAIWRSRLTRQVWKDRHFEDAADGSRPPSDAEVGNRVASDRVRQPRQSAESEGLDGRFPAAFSGADEGKRTPVFWSRARRVAAGVYS